MLCVCTASLLQAQLYVPLNVQRAQDTHTRTTTGQPGKDYWQNRGDYDLVIKFNPHSKLLEGTESIVYYNNSPDTLDRLIISLYPDYYKKGVLRLWTIGPDDENEGVKINSIVINGSSDVQGYNEETNFIALPSSYILPHSRSVVQISWSYHVNAGSDNRTGQIDKTSFFLAYTFPRIAVYDDIDGWNTHTYNGLQEFYHDFGNFNADITVPKNYCVWATGTLMNPNEVFTKQIQQNLNTVNRSDSVMYIITKEDAQNKKVTQQNKWNTFRFHAENVTDFAFALSDHYVWLSSSLKVDPSSKNNEGRVRIDAVYNPEHKDYERVASIARSAIDIMSNTYPGVPYPYPHETIFDGLDQMEYPMMVNDNPVEGQDAERGTVELTVHEIFHTYFPFYMGINETKYAWMDEGWANAGGNFISEKILKRSPESKEYTADYEAVAGTDLDLPLITPSTQLFDDVYWTESYDKAALTYAFLQDILGDALFFKALHYYMDQWNGKHPTPFDYFNCMNTGSGKDLNWFFNAWFYEAGYPDIAIDNVIQEKPGSAIIILINKGNKPVPVNVNISFADGSTKQAHLSAAIWETNNIYYLTVNTSSAIVKAQLNTDLVPDVQEKNNSWQR